MRARPALPRLAVLQQAHQPGNVQPRSVVCCRLAPAAVVRTVLGRGLSWNVRSSAYIRFPMSRSCGASCFFTYVDSFDIGKLCLPESSQPSEPMCCSPRRPVPSRCRPSRRGGPPQRRRPTGSHPFVSAVVACPVCGGSVNAEAARCPQCGANHRLPPSEAQAEVEQRDQRRFATVAAISTTGSRGSARRTFVALVVGLIYVALIGIVLFDLLDVGLGHRAPGVLLLSPPVVTVVQLLLLFVGRREDRRRAWERVAVVIASVIATACLLWTVFLIWLLILFSNVEFD